MAENPLKGMLKHIQQAQAPKLQAVPDVAKPTRVRFTTNPRAELVEQFHVLHATLRAKGIKVRKEDLQDEMFELLFQKYDIAKS